MDLRSGSLPAASEEKTRRTLTAERRGYPATQKNRGRQRAGLVEKPWPDRFGGLGDRRALLVLCSAPERAERVIHVGAIDPDRNFDHVRDRPLVLYLVNLLPVEGRLKQILRVVVVILGILSLVRYLGVGF